MDSFRVFTFVSLLFLLAACQQSGFQKPMFQFVEKNLVKILYKKDLSKTLHICCKGPAGIAKNDSFLLWISYCYAMPLCPLFRKETNCKTHGQQVCCMIDHVPSSTIIKAYVGENASVPLDQIATFITNSSEKLPKPVTNLSVTTTSKQGLYIRWNKFTSSDFSVRRLNYNTIVECQPLNNRQAYAVQKKVEFSISHVYIKARDVSAVTQYRCCVRVVNVLTSIPSDLSCRDVTTTEQAPSDAPVITCGNKTACPYVVRGTRRNITITFKLPGKRNGKVVRYEIFYKNNTSTDNQTTKATKIIINNSSATEAMIMNVDTASSLDVYMKYCNTIACSPVSNTVRIPAISFHEKTYGLPVLTIAIIVIVFGVLLTVGIGVHICRYLSRQRENTLPTLVLPNDSYAYPVVMIKDQDGEYTVLDEIKSDANKASEDIVMHNPCSVAKETDHAVTV